VELGGRHVVVTGAAGGIGAALGKRFAAEGARVTLADIDPERLAAIAGELGALAVPTDVSSEPPIRELIARATAAHGPIDLFFSNAGIGGPVGGPEAPDEEWQRIWQVNVMAHVWAARALLPAMLARGEGYLAATASAAGLLTQISTAPYTVTKHAAVALAEWLAINYGDAGVRVSVLCPQGVRTPMVELALAHDPVGSVPLLAEGLLEPDEVAEVTLAGIREERFLILPHPQVADYLALKGSDPERWLRGARRLARQARAAARPGAAGDRREPGP
jgi:NAD(P)-dependent dehydrogenase (short-subunit alcohol dehydrogenase family)